MTGCPACGAANPDDARFCGQCRSYLGWTDPAPTPGPAPEVEPAHLDPPPVQPDDVHPPRPPRPPRPAPPPDPEPAKVHLFCHRCGAGNERGRTFCRACGNRLAVPEADDRSWWQRFLDRWVDRGRRERRRRDRRPADAARRILAVVAVVCLLTLLAVLGPPLVGWAVNEVRDRVEDHVPLVPDGTRASSERTSAKQLVDGLTNRYWAPRGAAEGSWVEVRFREPVRVLDLIVTPGVSREQDRFLAAGRPRRLAVVATRANGEQVTGTLDLRDQAGPQEFDFEAADVVTLRLTVRAVYAPAEANPPVAIAEVEFFGRR
ncbi:MAG TPA: zinc ribbon domain-containing protein [Micromonospora sp.]